MLCESLQPCGWKGNAIIEAEDVRLMSICSAEDECIGFCRFSERESGLTVYERWSDIKFRCKGGGADTAGKNARKIAGYIQGRCFVRPADTRPAQPVYGRQVMKRVCQSVVDRSGLAGSIKGYAVA